MNVGDLCIIRAETTAGTYLGPHWGPSCFDVCGGELVVVIYADYRTLEYVLVLAKGKPVWVMWAHLQEVHVCHLL